MLFASLWASTRGRLELHLEAADHQVTWCSVFKTLPISICSEHLRPPKSVLPYGSTLQVGLYVHEIDNISTNQVQDGKNFAA
ncbi:hypothetical protein Y1Q_0011658 [Alligator mississippiensis]|uniref:Uncharacterized protein n=1 Tax=Alligator mississippiensis TaxID=8496 RepID=A0A151M0M0_ALLMI|nr:hypothetical protein Y1Q_0011658 [Alligator mississippiensis]